MQKMKNLSNSQMIHLLRNTLGACNRAMREIKERGLSAIETLLVIDQDDFDWAVEAYLDLQSPEDQVEYHKVVAAARVECHKVVDPAQVEFDKVVAAAHVEFDKVVDAAHVEYRKVVIALFFEMGV